MAMSFEKYQKLRKFLLEEPRRFAMDAFAAYGERQIRSIFGSDAPKEISPCKTACCLAGSAVIMEGLSVKEKINGHFVLLPPKDRNGYRGWTYTAAKVLDISPEEEDVLFNLSVWPQRFQLQYKRARSASGRAKSGAAMLDWFFKNYGEKDTPKSSPVSAAGA